MSIYKVKVGQESWRSCFFAKKSCFLTKEIVQKLLGTNKGRLVQAFHTLHHECYQGNFSTEGAGEVKSDWRWRKLKYYRTDMLLLSRILGIGLVIWYWISSNDLTAIFHSFAISYDSALSKKSTETSRFAVWSLISAENLLLSCFTGLICFILTTTCWILRNILNKKKMIRKNEMLKCKTLYAIANF